MSDATAPPIVLHESMLRFRCNQRGCCCHGWSIPWSGEDAARLIATLDGEDARAFIDFGHFVVNEHRVVEKVYPQERGGDRRCFFLTPEASCRVHGELGESALPGLCRSFPSHSERLGGALELRFDAICPEVLERLADPGPYELAAVDPAKTPAVATRITRPFRAPEVSIAGVDLSWDELVSLRQRIIDAFNTSPAPPLDVLARVNYAVARLAAGHAVATLEVREDEDPTEYHAYFEEAVRAHSEYFLIATLRPYRRFVFALDLEDVGDDVLRDALAYSPGWRAALAEAAPEVGELLRRYICHRFFGIYERSPQLNSLGLSYGTINHSVATALRFAWALAQALERPLDSACLRVGIGASEHAYRNVRMPVSVMPWFGIDAEREQVNKPEKIRLN
jgi:Fe-S-cluster containining protein